MSAVHHHEQKGKKMNKTSRTALRAVALCLPLVAVATVLPASADPVLVITPAALTPRSTFTDDVSLRLVVKDEHGSTKVRLMDLSRTAVVKITVPPGLSFPQHTHPGPVIVNVAEGQLTYVDADCEQHVYPKGTAFVDTGTDVHSAFGSPTETTVLFATFLGVPATGFLTVPETVQVPCG